MIPAIWVYISLWTMISCWRWPSAALTWRRMISRPRSDHVGAAWPKGGRRRTALPALLPGRGRPARAPFGFLVQALPVVVPASNCSVCCLSLVGPRICWRVGGTRHIPVEALFPQGRERFELGSSGGSQILGINAIGGPPYCDLADK